MGLTLGPILTRCRGQGKRILLVVKYFKRFRVSYNNELVTKNFYGGQGGRGMVPNVATIILRRSILSIRGPKMDFGSRFGKFFLESGKN